MSAENKVENLVVGQKVILNREMLGEPVGSVGYVYEEYQDFDNPNKRGVSIIFMNGGYDRFSYKEQEMYLTPLRVDSRYSTYFFSGVINVWRDYRNGYWDFS